MYATVEQLKNEGATGNDERIESSIKLASAYIEKMTGQWFKSRSKEIFLDGNGLYTIYLPVFAIEIESIHIFGKEVAPDDFTLYNRFVPDDRESPKIKFLSSVPSGHKNVRIKGNFGYVEENGDSPFLIQKICMKLALNEIGLLSDTGRTLLLDRARIVSENTDGHSYELSKILSSGAYTGDPEIDNVLIHYKRLKRLKVASV